MNRSKMQQILPAAVDVPPGEVVVPTRVLHPERGRVDCPAARLVAGSLRRRGVSTRLRQVRVASDGAPATLAITSYLQRDGRAVGLGAAASDPVGQRMANEVTTAWSAVLQSRSVMVADVQAQCTGAGRMMDLVAHAVTVLGAPVYVVGALPASPDTMESLVGRGVVLTASAAEVPRGATIVFPAAGVRCADRATASARNLRVVDGTCPLVSAAQAEVSGRAAAQDHVVVVGRNDCAGLPGLLSQAPASITLVQTVADVGALPDDIRGSLAYVVQPGLPMEDVTPIVAALRRRFGAVRGPDPEQLCFAASDRVGTVRAAAAAADVVLVLGSADHPDTRDLAAIVAGLHVPYHIVVDVADVRPEWLAGSSTIGVVGTVSARSTAIEDATRGLSGLGPTGVVRRRLSSRASHEPARSRQPDPDSTLVALSSTAATARLR